MSGNLMRCVLPGGHVGEHVWCSPLVKSQPNDCSAHYFTPAPVSTVRQLPSVPVDERTARLIDAVIFLSVKLQEFAQDVLDFDRELAIAADVVAQYGHLVAADAEGGTDVVMRH